MTKSYYKLNAAKCLICSTVVVATKHNELHKCECGNLTVGGDLSSGGLIRYIKQMDYHQDEESQFEELSQYDTGHSVASGHVIIKPLTALDEFVKGRCFIQHHIHSPERGWHMLDEYGQSLQVVEVIASKDGLHSVSVRFRFRPVAGINFYQCGDITGKGIEFFRYIQDEIIPKFMQTNRSRYALVHILRDNGFQDRTGVEVFGGEWKV